MEYKVLRNPNDDTVNNIITALKSNEGYCPCRIDKIPENKCMCKEFREGSTGFCHCGLYYKVPKINFIAVDFDGTIVSDKFPSIGDPNIPLINKLRLMHDSGIKIILHTCRENGELDREGHVRMYIDEAVNWCKVNNVPIDAVNENPWVPFGQRKIYADIYLDDRGFNVNDIERL